MKRLLIVLAVALVVLTSAGCFETKSTSPQPGGGEPIAGETSTPETQAEILQHSQECEELGRYWNCTVTGVVKNVSSDDLDMVEVYVEWYDASGVMLKRGWDYIGDLRAGQSARFEAGWYYEKVRPDHYVIWAEWTEWW